MNLYRQNLVLVKFLSVIMACERHLLGLSGGKDSSALAIYLKETRPDLPIEYFFSDTGEELPEIYDYLGKLEAFLGQKITYINPRHNFEYYLKRYNNFLPSASCRWCTINLKIIPFEQWIKPFLQQGDTIYSYIALRADESSRTGMISKNTNLNVIAPFKEAGINKQGVLEILNNAGLGLPDFYKWRSRSGCTFCFYQKKIDWVGLYEHHPEAFKKAMELEKKAAFTWCENETLEDLIKPQRMAEIKAQALMQRKIKVKINPLDG